MKQNRNEYMKSYREKKRSEITEASKLRDEITRSYRETRAQMEDALAQSSVGTAVHLKHLESIAKLDRDYRKELSERGLAPSNLGAATKPGWVFKAIIGRDGNPTVVEVRPGQAEPKSEPRRLNECAECRARVIAALEAEFPTDTPTNHKTENEE